MTRLEYHGAGRGEPNLEVEDPALARQHGNGANTDPITEGPWEDCPDDRAASHEAEWKCRGYGAARCYIFPATKTYNGTVARGQLFESVTDSENAWGSNDCILIHSIDTHCITPSKRTALQNSTTLLSPADAGSPTT